MLGAAGGIGTIRWSRSGPGPGLDRVTFESSADGAMYTMLGVGVRVGRGWQLGGLSLPKNQNLFIRARGYAGAVFGSVSASLMESTRNVDPTTPASFTDHPLIAGVTVFKVYTTEFARVSTRSGPSTGARLCVHQRDRRRREREGRGRHPKMRTALAQVYAEAGLSPPVKPIKVSPPAHRSVRRTSRNSGALSPRLSESAAARSDDDAASKVVSGLSPREMDEDCIPAPVAARSWVPPN